eukprot:maker-scaffold_78-snap-gene-0.3-mRNA-1 protein AED:0.02 eAED:0.02 QI:178/1/1/1/1/1/2/135/99
MSAFKKLIPLADRILIKRAQQVQKTAAGIYLPESAQQKERTGEVMAVGPGARDQQGNVIPMSVIVGDTVLLPEYGGQNLELDGEEFQLFRDQDLLGKFE